MAAKKKAVGEVGLASVVKTAHDAVRAARMALSAIDLAQLTADERLHSGGRLRDGEEAALTTLLDTIDAHGPTFQSLADRDGGGDPTALETGPARAALARRALFAPLATELEALLTSVNDDVLASADVVKQLTVPAYAIAKANAPVNAKLRKSVSGALDFYKKLAKRKKSG